MHIRGRLVFYAHHASFAQIDISMRVIKGDKEKLRLENIIP